MCDFNKVKIILPLRYLQNKFIAFIVPSLTNPQLSNRKCVKFVPHLFKNLNI